MWLVDKKESNIIPYISVLEEIAIININKSGGGSNTPSGKLDTEYKRDGVKDFLFKQIEFINPDIIINAHLVSQFFCDQVGTNEIIVTKGARYSKNHNRLLIWTRHPNRAHEISYCNSIVKIVNDNY